ncbi:alpha/beta fold hydrolase [Streptomyces sp. NBC_01217]|uniref:alpha/beta fold hydrolase n=1 Tax=Streptomyces sp. NBC_01217 TaxID=2903779 RepID=UPI002E15FDB1|nr:alpha/beta hydrolase [Streptomyces sp. NBC_01217]
MRHAQVTADGARIRWVELPGRPGTTRTRVYLHGLGASSGPYFTASAVHPLLADSRSLLMDLLGFGISDRPTEFGYTLEEHADAVAAALEAADAYDTDVVAHSMGGAVAIVLAARHPHLVARLVLVDANLDPVAPGPARPGSSGIAAYTEEEFLTGGLAKVRERVGPHWWATMRLAGPEALHRTAVNLARGTTPTMRELLLDLKIPRTYLRPLDNGPLPGEDALIENGVRVVAVPECGHNIMLDNPEAFARQTALAVGA